ncbi:MAG: hypothetical protein ACXVBX_11415, partial [Flavisolibacter sp.]
VFLMHWIEFLNIGVAKSIVATNQSMTTTGNCHMVNSVPRKPTQTACCHGSIVYSRSIRYFTMNLPSG